MAYSPTWIVSIQVAGFGRILGTICYLKELSTCHICIHLCIKYSRFQGSALPQKTSALSTSALPPDVRRWLCPAVSNRIIPGLCPWSGLSPTDLLGQRPHQGHSPKNKKGIPRRGKATASHPAAKPNHQRRTFRAKPKVSRFQGFEA